MLSLLNRYVTITYNYYICRRVTITCICMHWNSIINVLLFTIKYPTENLVVAHY